MTKWKFHGVAIAKIWPIIRLFYEKTPPFPFKN